jgi:NADH-quinone oxidoreductase subunit G
MITVTVCVGSSCHVKGARKMIAGFSDFLAKEGLEDRIELKGSFCMERCGEGINWMIDEETISSPTADAGIELFQTRVLGLLNKEQPEKDSDQRRI